MADAINSEEFGPTNRCSDSNEDQSLWNSGNYTSNTKTNAGSSKSASLTCGVKIDSTTFQRITHVLQARIQDFDSAFPCGCRLWVSLAVASFCGVRVASEQAGVLGRSNHA